MNRNRPTIQDVARRAGVSSATVSRVLSHSPKVAGETRLHVLKVIQEMGYSPNRVARSLRVQRSPIIGMIVSDIRNPFFTSTVRAVEDVTRAQGFSLLLCNTDEDVKQEEEYLALMWAERVSGVIITPADEQACRVGPLLQDRIPVVTLDRAIRSADVDTVLLDNHKAATDLVDLLIRGGHSRIAAIIGLPGTTTGRQRLEGFGASHRAHNLEIDPSLIHQVHPTEMSGFQCANRLFDLGEPPTALFMGNNLLMHGALRAILARGLELPDEIAVVGIDHTDWMPLFRPGLTVVEQPTYEMGRIAANLLFQRAANSDLAPRKIVLEGKVIMRKSHYASSQVKVMSYA